jgi:transcriptional regulator
MGDPMTTITEARDAYLSARQAVTDSRLALGKAIAAARAQGVEQVDIARTLGLTREQIRRYETEYRAAQ